MPCIPRIEEMIYVSVVLVHVHVFLVSTSHSFFFSFGGLDSEIGTDVQKFFNRKVYASLCVNHYFYHYYSFNGILQL